MNITQRKKFANSPFMPKGVGGKPKKTQRHAFIKLGKDSPLAHKENRELKDRPPTRRNPNDFTGLADKAEKGKSPQRTASLKNLHHISRSPNHSKYKTTSLRSGGSGSSHPQNRSVNTSEQHEYLQFSLRITEEIIRNDLYKSDEMMRVLRSHYQANKAKLNSDKLLKTLAELCAELNIPLDEKTLEYLESKRPEASIILPRATSPASPSSVVSESTSQATQVSPRPFPVGVATLERKMKPPPSSAPQNPPSGHLMASTSTLTDPPLAANDVGLNGKKTLLLATANTADDMAKIFEFGEETLKGPALDAQFQILHDATDRFCDSETSLRTTEPMKLFIEKLTDKQPPKEKERTLGVTHYQLSVEPVRVATKELSVQTLDGSQTSSVVIDVGTQKSFDIDDVVVCNRERSSIKCQHCGSEEHQIVPSKAAIMAVNGEQQQQYVLLDCPVLIPKEHTKSVDFLQKRSCVNLDDIGKSLHALNLRISQQQELLINNKAVAVSEAGNKDVEIYDLTPQKDAMPPPTDQNALLATDRYDRYKKVNENLAFFYPTIATQVTSMDLLAQDVVPYVKRNNQENLNRKSSKNPQYTHQQSNGNSKDLVRSIKTANKGYNNYSNVNMNHFNNMRSIESSRMDIGGGTRPPTVAFDGSNMSLLQTGNRKEHINLDNYRIDSSQHVFADGRAAIELPVPPSTGQKRHYTEDVSPDREISTLMTTRSQWRNSEHIADKGERMTMRNPTDSVEKRIMSLRHDIEKYSSKDDDLTSRNQTTSVGNAPDSSRRLDLLDMLKPSKSLLSAEMTVQRRKKMSVLRKQT